MSPWIRLAPTLYLVSCAHHPNFVDPSCQLIPSLLPVDADSTVRMAAISAPGMYSYEIAIFRDRDHVKRVVTIDDVACVERNRQAPTQEAITRAEAAFDEAFAFSVPPTSFEETAHSETSCVLTRFDDSGRTMVGASNSDAEDPVVRGCKAVADVSSIRGTVLFAH